jgi:homoserine O-acetyltransferase
MCVMPACAAGRTSDVLRSPDLVLRGGPAPDSFRVRFETSQGDFIVRVRRHLAPIGVDRFHALVRHGFFDDQRFFRVRAGFIAQFGLHGDPAVIAAWKGRPMPDDPTRLENRRGTLAYAFTTPGTRSTQIYINLADNPRLDAEPFSPFGEIIEGVAVIDRLYAGYDESAGGGMRGGQQGEIERGGNEWLKARFPRLDYIRRARIVGK